MAEAKKCDRCGTYYGAHLNNSYLCMVCPCPIYTNEKTVYDLCEDCLDDFDEFMMGAKPKNLLKRIKAKIRKD